MVVFLDVVKSEGIHNIAWVFGAVYIAAFVPLLIAFLYLLRISLFRYRLDEKGVTHSFAFFKRTRMQCIEMQSKSVESMIGDMQ